MLIQVFSSFLHRSSLMTPWLPLFWCQFALLRCMEHTSFYVGALVPVVSFWMRTLRRSLAGAPMFVSTPFYGRLCSWNSLDSSSSPLLHICFLFSPLMDVLKRDSIPTLDCYYTRMQTSPHRQARLMTAGLSCFLLRTTPQVRRITIVTPFTGFLQSRRPTFTFSRPLRPSMRIQHPNMS